MNKLVLQYFVHKLRSCSYLFEGTVERKTEEGLGPMKK